LPTKQHWCSGEEEAGIESPSDAGFDINLADDRAIDDPPNIASSECSTLLSHQNGSLRYQTDGLKSAESKEACARYQD
jgi:hypothetical protein